MTIGKRMRSQVELEVCISRYGWPYHACVSRADRGVLYSPSTFLLDPLHYCDGGRSTSRQADRLRGPIFTLYAWVFPGIDVSYYKLIACKVMVQQPCRHAGPAPRVCRERAPTYECEPEGALSRIHYACV